MTQAHFRQRLSRMQTVTNLLSSCWGLTEPKIKKKAYVTQSPEDGGPTLCFQRGLWVALALSIWVQSLKLKIMMMVALPKRAHKCCYSTTAQGRKLSPHNKHTLLPIKWYAPTGRTSRKVDCCVKIGAVPLRPGVVDGDGVKQHIQSP